MEKTLEDIRLILFVIMACVVAQTTWFFGEKVLDPAAAIATSFITDVNITHIGGKPVGSHYSPAIRVVLE